MAMPSEHLPPPDPITSYSTLFLLADVCVSLFLPPPSSCALVWGALPPEMSLAGPESAPTLNIHSRKISIAMVSAAMVSATYLRIVNTPPHGCISGQQILTDNLFALLVICLQVCNAHPPPTAPTSALTLADDGADDEKR